MKRRGWWESGRGGVVGATGDHATTPSASHPPLLNQGGEHTRAGRLVRCYHCLVTLTEAVAALPLASSARAEIVELLFLPLAFGTLQL